jgi:hypothetical protein
MRVFKNFQFDGTEESLRRMFSLLFPGGVEAVCGRVAVAMQKTAREKGARASPYERDALTVGEFLVFIGLLISATLFTECGRDLFAEENVPRLFSSRPNFHLYQGRHRFEFIKTHCPFGFANADQSHRDPWFMCRRGVDDFNATMLNVLMPIDVITPDESMCSWRPRTTSTGRLPHLTYCPRKPEPFGTELKDVADGRNGLLRYPEIQEGEKEMAKKKFARRGLALMPLVVSALHLGFSALNIVFIVDIFQFE